MRSRELNHRFVYAGNLAAYWRRRIDIFGVGVYNIFMDKQICSTCHTEKDLNDFQLDSGKRSGHDVICKLCRKDKRKLKKDLDNSRRKSWYHSHKNIEKARYEAKYKFPIPKECAVEGCEEIGERHHLDYNFPLDIVWLCKRHHYMAHRVNRILKS